MPQVEQEKKQYLSATWKIVIVVAVVVVAVGAGVALFLYQRDQDRKAVQSAISDWQPLILRGHYDEATVRLKAVYPRAHTKQEQLNLLYYEGATSMAKGDMKAAQTNFKAFVTLNGGLTHETARQLGYASAQLGEKSEAIDYDKQAIELLKKSDDPQRDDDVRELENRIKALESGK